MAWVPAGAGGAPAAALPQGVLARVTGAVLCPGGGGGGAAGCASGLEVGSEVAELEALLELLASRCPRARDVVLLSSAFVAGPRAGPIPPEPLPAALGPCARDVSALAAHLRLPSAQVLRKAAAELAAAEWMRVQRPDFDLHILRPSLVGAPESEAFAKCPGGDLTPVQGLLALALVGVLHTVSAPAAAKVDLVPLDEVGRAAARLARGGAPARGGSWLGRRKAGRLPRVHHCVRGLAGSCTVGELVSACNLLALRYRNQQHLWRFVACDPDPRVHAAARRLEGLLPTLLAAVAPALGGGRERAAVAAARALTKLGSIHDSQALEFFTRHTWDFAPPGGAGARPSHGAEGAAAAMREARAAGEALAERGVLARERPPNWRAEYCVQKLADAARGLVLRLPRRRPRPAPYLPN